MLLLHARPGFTTFVTHHIAANPFNNEGADTTAQTHDKDIGHGEGVSLETPVSQEPFHDDTFGLGLDASSEDSLPRTPNPMSPLSEAHVTSPGANF